MLSADENSPSSKYHLILQLLPWKCREKTGENKETTQCHVAGERLHPYLPLLSQARADEGPKVSHLLGDKEFLSC